MTEFIYIQISQLWKINYENITCFTTNTHVVDV